MDDLLFVLQFILAAAITVVVLLQKSSSIGLGVYSSSNDSLFGAKGPAGFLAKVTFFLGLMFAINTLALGYTYAQKSQRSVLDTVNKESLVPAIPLVGGYDQNRSFETLVPPAQTDEETPSSSKDINQTATQQINTTPVKEESNAQ